MRLAAVISGAVLIGIGPLGLSAEAAEGKPPPAPPGVIIEPPRPRPRQNEADAPPPAQDRQEKQGPGCPANDRKLELIV